MLRTLREVAAIARTAFDIALAGVDGFLQGRPIAVVDHAAGGLAVALGSARILVARHFTADVAGLGDAMLLAHGGVPSVMTVETILRLANS
jgi:predicted alpha/beta hydrolase